MREGGCMLEKNNFMVLDEGRAAVILLRVLLQKGRINQKTFDKVVKKYMLEDERRQHNKKW